MKTLFNIVFQSFCLAFKIGLAFLPAILVVVALTENQLLLRQGKALAVATDKQIIHELFPNSSWNDFEPCGKYFNEQEEFNKALSCVNTKVWPETPITSAEQAHIPRCFIVKAGGPDIFTKDGLGFNFVPVMDVSPAGIAIGAIVGVYQPETRTVFIVENIDAPAIYRHELQHYFLHSHNPETEGGGHHQSIWQKCEAPYYTPSDKVKQSVKK